MKNLFKKNRVYLVCGTMIAFGVSYAGNLTPAAQTQGNLDYMMQQVSQSLDLKFIAGSNKLAVVLPAELKQQAEDALRDNVSAIALVGIAQSGDQQIIARLSSSEIEHGAVIQLPVDSVFRAFQLMKVNKFRMTLEDAHALGQLKNMLIETGANDQHILRKSADAPMANLDALALTAKEPNVYNNGNQQAVFYITSSDNDPSTGFPTWTGNDDQERALTISYQEDGQVCTFPLAEVIDKQGGSYTPNCGGGKVGFSMVENSYLHGSVSGLQNVQYQQLTAANHYAMASLLATTNAKSAALVLYVSVKPTQAPGSLKLIAKIDAAHNQTKRQVSSAADMNVVSSTVVTEKYLQSVPFKLEKLPKTDYYNGQQYIMNRHGYAQNNIYGTTFYKISSPFAFSGHGEIIVDGSSDINTPLTDTEFNLYSFDRIILGQLYLYRTSTTYADSITLKTSEWINGAAWHNSDQKWVKFEDFVAGTFNIPYLDDGYTLYNSYKSWQANIHILGYDSWGNQWSTLPDGMQIDLFLGNFKLYGSKDSEKGRADWFACFPEGGVYISGSQLGNQNVECDLPKFNPEPPYNQLR